MAGDLPMSNDLLPEHACPHCGQADTDELVWLDDDRVRCQRCMTTYRPASQDPSRN